MRRTPEPDPRIEIVAADERIRFYRNRQHNRQDMADHLTELAQEDGLEVAKWEGRRDFWLGQLGASNIVVLQTNVAEGGLTA